MSIQNDITDAINKNLPAAVASQLRTYLDQAEVDKLELSRLRGRNADLEKDFVVKRERIDKLTKQVAEAGDLEKKRLDTEARARGFELELAKAAQGAAHREKETVLELAKIVFKNPTLTYSQTGYDLYPGDNLPGVLTSDPQHGLRDE